MALFLVDGHALAYRSHYAFAHNPLINSQGEETSAVYGFINTLLTLFDKYSPPYIAVTFDSAGKTFRHEKFEAYKANRKPMPEPLAAQLPIIFAVLDAMRIRHVALQGYEADDIIATLTRRWSNEIPVDIVTGDKDLFQLINDRVRVIRPGRGSVLDSELDPPALEEKIGLKPEQIVDYLALMGDSSDNIPGVRGVGEKTAKKLLAEYGNLKSIYEHIDDIPSASLKQKLVNGHEDAIMSSDLVTLDDKVPINMELAELAFGEFRTDEFRELLDDLEFTRMRRSLYDAYKPPPPPPTTPPVSLLPRRVSSLTIAPSKKRPSLSPWPSGLRALRSLPSIQKRHR